MINFSLRDFVLTGKLGLIELGINREKVKQLLGEPYNWFVEKQNPEDWNKSSIWKYGGMELYFDEHDILYMIFTDHWDHLSDEHVQIDPWIFTPTLQLEVLKKRLEAEQIVYQQKINYYGKTNEYLQPRLYFPKSGVRLDFDTLDKGATEQEINNAGYPALVKTNAEL